MAKEIFNLLECPSKSETCIGLLVSATGSAMGLQQNENGYIVMADDGEGDICEGFGNCSNYEKCYIKLLNNSIRKSAEMTPGFAMEAYN